LTFNAPKTLLQFTVIENNFNTTLDGSRLQVDIKLQRIISYHLTNTYMPTITLLIIAEVTLQLVKTSTKDMYSQTFVQQPPLGHEKSVRLKVRPDKTEV
jgi:hypothetical protein